MPRRAPTSLKPRKTPVQARSTATIEAVHEAAIQVLLASGATQLTTTRVAERAGVSVGTLYQYYPNKQSLLFAVLERHMNTMFEAVDVACKDSRGRPMADVVHHVAEAFVDAKMARSDVSKALYRIAAEIDGPAVVRNAFGRSARSLEAALKAAPDYREGIDKFVIQMLFGAMAGTTKSVLESGAQAAMIKHLRRHLALLARSYLAAARLAD